MLLVLLSFPFVLALQLEVTRFLLCTIHYRTSFLACASLNAFPSHFGFPTSTRSKPSNHKPKLGRYGRRKVASVRMRADEAPVFLSRDRRGRMKYMVFAEVPWRSKGRAEDGLLTSCLVSLSTTHLCGEEVRRKSCDSSHVPRYRRHLDVSSRGRMGTARSMRGEQRDAQCIGIPTTLMNGGKGAEMKDVLWKVRDGDFHGICLISRTDGYIGEWLRDCA
nr:hypothetical protein CFP56_01093 [Quercus suber]